MNMSTNVEKYGHADMSNDELEERIAADLFELSDRLGKNVRTATIGNLLWGLMGNIREAYRTARLITRGEDVIGRTETKSS